MTPQKQPPANTAVSFPACDASATSVAGGGIGGLGAAKQGAIASDNPTATWGTETEKVIVVLSLQDTPETTCSDRPGTPYPLISGIFRIKFRPWFRVDVGCDVIRLLRGHRPG